MTDKLEAAANTRYALVEAAMEFVSAWDRRPSMTGSMPRTETHIEALRAALEPSPEPTFDELIHSGGRCTCSGEGRCAWCRELAASENRAAVPICKCGYLLVRGLCQYARCSEYKAPPGGSKP